MPLGGFRYSFCDPVIQVSVLWVGAVVRDPGERPHGVAEAGNRQPLETVGEVLADREFQPALIRRLLPQTHSILPRDGRYCDPSRLVFGIPQIKIVMVDAHGHEVFRSGPLVKRHQTIGIELVAFPCLADSLVAKPRRMAASRDGILIMAGT